MPEEVREVPQPIQPVPTEPKKKSNFKIIALLLLVILLLAGGVYAGMQLEKKKVRVWTEPPFTVEPTAVPDETANWKTFTNSIYGYSVKAPSDFTLKLCSDCNPPEVAFALQNPSGSISIGFAYSSQGSLTGNAQAGEYTPVNNLKVVIQGKAYKPEEYYDTIYKLYVFDIESVLNDGEDKQIRAGGRYKNEADKQLVSQILSTFKFIDQKETMFTCPQNFWLD